MKLGNLESIGDLAKSGEPQARERAQDAPGAGSAFSALLGDAAKDDIERTRGRGEKHGQGAGEAASEKGARRRRGRASERALIAVMNGVGQAPAAQAPVGSLPYSENAESGMAPKEIAFKTGREAWQLDRNRKTDPKPDPKPDPMKAAKKLEPAPADLGPDFKWTAAERERALTPKGITVPKPPRPSSTPGEAASSPSPTSGSRFGSPTSGSRFPTGGARPTHLPLPRASGGEGWGEGATADEKAQAPDGLPAAAERGTQERQSNGKLTLASKREDTGTLAHPIAAVADRAREGTFSGTGTGSGGGLGGEGRPGAGSNPASGPDRAGGLAAPFTSFGVPLWGGTATIEASPEADARAVDDSTWAADLERPLGELLGDLAVKGDEASLRLTTPSGDELGLFVRVRDGAAEVRASGAAAPLLEGRTPELGQALAEQGLALGSFDTSSGGGRQGSDSDRPETLGTEAAGNRITTPMPAKSSSPETKPSPAARPRRRIHVTA